LSNPSITLIGRLATEPDFRVLSSGTAITRFRVISNDRRKNSAGEWEDHDTSGWNVVAWDRLAENILGKISRGEQVIVHGVIKEISWQDSSTGQTRYSFEIKAQHIGKDLLLDSSSKRNNSLTNIDLPW
jgi:single-strand DNA-binding protein